MNTAKPPLVDVNVCVAIKRSFTKCFALISQDDHIKNKELHIHEFINLYGSNNNPSDNNVSKTGKWLNKLVHLTKKEYFKVLGIILNISTSNQKLKSEQQAIFSSDLIGVIRLSQHQVIWANSAFENMLGYELGELIGKPARIFYINEDDFESMNIIYEEIRNIGTAHAQCNSYVRWSAHMDGY